MVWMIVGTSGTATPILMLTAKTTEEDRIRGLELGPTTT